MGSRRERLVVFVVKMSVKSMSNCRLLRRVNSHLRSSYATHHVCPHQKDVLEGATLDNALPYNEIPGPRAIPILGNTWR